MPQHDIRAATQVREAGLAKISMLTWRAGAAAVAVAGLLTAALGHHSAARAAPAGHRNEHGAIVIPAQPPGQTASTGQVTSGAS